MRAATVRLLALAAAIGYIPIAGIAQLTVDARGPIRERKRESDFGRGGGVGRKIPLLVAVQVRGSLPDASGEVEILFTLTNPAKEALMIPFSPNPGDLEPSDPNSDYSVEDLALSISEVNGTHRPLTMTVLFGRPEVRGTLIALAPGQSMRVLARVKLPSPSPAGPNAMTLIAGAALSNEIIKTVKGQRISDLQEIGSARSTPFTLWPLLDLPK
jgi:hypothetical protein